MHAWWTGLADVLPEEARALHALGLGFMAARTLHVALELRLFTHLAAGAQTLSQVAQALGLTVVRTNGERVCEAELYWLQGEFLLAPIYTWFTEGFDIVDLQDAKALLDALA